MLGGLLGALDVGVTASVAGLAFAMEGSEGAGAAEGWRAKTS